MKNGVGLAAIFLVPILVIVIFLGMGSSSSAQAGCLPGASANVGALTSGSVAGYQGEQLKNAALIVNAGKALGLSLQGQTVGVMVAMGESSLMVLDHGDVAGPDSRGLFQQRDNGAWGSLTDRMNPTISATNFFKALQKVAGWESMTPTEAAHKTQRNADPFHYEKYFQPASAVVAAVTGVKITDAGACPSQGGAGVPGYSGAGDDYPWKNSPINTSNPSTHFDFRECVDFAWWRLLQQVGTPQPPYVVDSLKVHPGSALTWRAAWERQGWTVSQTPKVGAIIWYDASPISSPLGHVGVVKAVNADGSILEEGYNMLPNDHQYYTRTIKPGFASAFLYIPTKDQL